MTERVLLFELGERAQALPATGICPAGSARPA